MVTESGSGQVVEVVISFRALPASGVATLASNQPLCLNVVRSQGFTAPLLISAGRRSTIQPGTGDLGKVVPPRCRGVCRVRVTITSGALTEVTYPAYRSGS